MIYRLVTWYVTRFHGRKLWVQAQEISARRERDAGVRAAVNTLLS